jgi:hypothetical protein
MKLKVTAVFITSFDFSADSITNLAAKVFESYGGKRVIKFGCFNSNCLPSTFDTNIL